MAKYISSIEFFQFLLAPLPFSLCQVIRFWRWKEDEIMGPIIMLVTQSQHTYIEALGFSKRLTFLIHSSVYLA